MISVIGWSQKLVQFPLPINNSIKNIGLITGVNTSTLVNTKKGSVGISSSQSKLYFSVKRNIHKIVFEVPNASELLTTGLNTVINSKKKVEWNFDSSKESKYKLYIATASDSAKNFIVYSGYIYYPSLNKWKLIASFKINGSIEDINEASLFISSTVTTNLEEIFTNSWTQGDNGTWNKLQNTESKVVE